MEATDVVAPSAISIFSLLTQYGIVGIVLGACGWFVYKREEQQRKKDAAAADLHRKEVMEMQQLHREERRELVQTLNIQHSEGLVVSKEVADALRTNAQAFTELSTLIRDRK